MFGDFGRCVRLFPGSLHFKREPLAVRVVFQFIWQNTLKGHLGSPGQARKRPAANGFDCPTFFRDRSQCSTENLTEERAEWQAIKSCAIRFAPRRPFIFI